MPKGIVNFTKIHGCNCIRQWNESTKHSQTRKIIKIAHTVDLFVKKKPAVIIYFARIPQSLFAILIIAILKKEYVQMSGAGFAEETILLIILLLIIHLDARGFNMVCIYAIKPIHTKAE